MPPQPDCLDLRRHGIDLPDEVLEHACGHQVWVLPCGCHLDDHDTETCDGLTVAELEAIS